jgi:rfaE bifunctional protein kinase chain/domain
VEKVISLENLKKKIINFKINKKKRIVLCHGTFDLIHLGHLRHFSEAKKYGDILVVTVTADKYVSKGLNRPFFSTIQRMESLSHISDIDFISYVDSPDAVDLIKYLKPNIYCKGPDYKNFKNDTTGKIYQEMKALKSVGGILKVTTAETFSSSKILNEHFETLSNEQKNIITKIKKTIKTDPKELINSFNDLKILILGETIIDKYIYCDPIGKSGKDSILTFKKMNESYYPGGVLAIARHVSDFVKKITVITSVGEKNEYKNFIIKNSNKKNTNFKFFPKNKSSTIVKTRYLDSINLNKVFGIYDLDDHSYAKKSDAKILATLKKEMKQHDIIIVSDYGHGFLSKNISKVLNKSKNFIALNTQINSSNMGYHGLDKYKNVNLLIINEREIRFELKDRYSDLKKIIKKLSSQKNIDFLVVTQGNSGSIMYCKKDDKFFECPAFAAKVVDKVGAGDAMLALLSLAVKKKFDFNLSLLLGSLSAAQNVESISNSAPCNKKIMTKHLEHIFK